MGEEVKPPTHEELTEYHALMDRLKGVNGLKAAAAFPNASVFWDFKLKRASPGRIWHDTSPDWLKAELLRPYTQEELQACRVVSGIDKAASVPEGTKPTVLVVIGPGAAGKSTALPMANKTLDIVVDEFVMVDGDDLRSCHQGWKAHIEQENVHGYKDAFDIFRDNPDMKMKEKLMKESMESRKNLVVPINKSKPGILQKFKDKDYKVFVLAMLTSAEESKARCINRANENGRYPGAQKVAYLQCLDDLVELCRPEHSDKVVVIDSTDFANMKTVFSRINDMSVVEKLAQQYKDAVPDSH